MWLVAVCTVYFIGYCAACGSNPAMNYNQLVK